jgi:hypothetical protein
MLKKSVPEAVHIIEASLGLSSQRNPSFKRLMDYYQAILKVEAVFFFESFKKDPLYVASYILKLRDELVLNGWDGKSLGEERIDDLAKIEKVFNNTDGYPERLKTVLLRLAQARNQKLPPLLITGLESAFTRLELELIKATDYKVEVATPGHNPIMFYQFDSGFDAGRSLVNYLSKNQKKWKTTALIVPTRCSELVASYFKRAGIPFGSSDSLPTTSLAHLQLIIGMMNLSLMPKNPEVALKILAGEVSPVRHPFLANALKETPSFESEAWKKAIEKLEGMDEKVKEWILDAGAVDEESIAKDLLVKKVVKLKTWFNQIGQIKKEDAYLGSASLCQELETILTAWTATTLTYNELQKILRDMIGQGLKREKVLALAGGPRIYGSPEEVDQTFEEILWFDFSQSTAQGKFNYYWGPKELENLCKQGLSFHSTKTLTDAALHDWAKPLTHGAVKAFYFKASLEGTKEAVHPLFHYKKGEYTPLQDKELGLEEVDAKFWEDFVATEEITVKPEDLKFPTAFSYSSLSTMLSCSARYYFEKTLGLGEISGEDLEPTNLIFGNILHKVMEVAFKEKMDGPQRLLLIDKVIREFAPILDSKSYSKKRLSLKNVIVDSFKTLDLFIKQNKLEFIDAEAAFTKDFVDTYKLYGKVDMLLGRNGKVELILDFKYSNSRKHTELFQEKRAVQLSLYAHLAAQEGIMPGIAYFIATDERIIANRHYEGALYYEMNTTDVVEMVKNKTQSVLTDLDKGIVKVNGMSDKYKDADFIPECRYCSFHKLCGKAWE